MRTGCLREKTSIFCPSSLQLVSIIVFLFSMSILAGCKNSEPVKAQLISEFKSIQPGQTFCVALRLEMAKQWHTYWKNPGDSGMPTKIEWHLPDGFHASGNQWPIPQKIETPHDVSFGYEGEVFLLTDIKAPDTVESGSSVEISASVNWLACKEICIPGNADLILSLPVDTKKSEPNKRWARRLAATRRNLPQRFSDWEVKASAKNGKILIRIIPPPWFKEELADISFFPEQEGIIDLSGKQQFQSSKDEYVLEVQRSIFAEKLPRRLQGVLISKHGWSQSGQEKALIVDVFVHRLE
ncbi:MAG: protein-disulfide reductase DsbD family protein [Candidatus Aminicenantes bacterium]|jgi:thiol:disulfide interchange protein DsbD